MQVNTFYCHNQCCRIYTTPYDDNISKDWIYTHRERKAGVLIYNSFRSSILLVQSRGQRWGVPKGSVEPEENTLACAVRELSEETGVNLNESVLRNPVKIQNHATYYLYDAYEEPGKLPLNASTIDNDVSGLTWINVNCLKDLLLKPPTGLDTFRINYHTRLLLFHHFNLDMSVRSNGPTFRSHELQSLSNCGSYFYSANLNYQQKRFYGGTGAGIDVENAKI